MIHPADLIQWSFFAALAVFIFGIGLALAVFFIRGAVRATARNPHPDVRVLIDADGHTPAETAEKVRAAMNWGAE